MRIVLLSAVFFWAACSNIMAQEDILIGEALVMEYGQAVTINTGLPCDQGIYLTPNYELEYEILWQRLDEGDFQGAFNILHWLPSRLLDEGLMLDDFRVYLAGQPGMPHSPWFYFQGRSEEVVGDPRQPLTPAWCFSQFGTQFLYEEFGIGLPGMMEEIKRYPRWETSGALCLETEFSSGKMTLKATAPDAENCSLLRDYNDVALSELIYYLPSEGAKPLLQFVVTVVPNRSDCSDSVPLPVISTAYGWGTAVPLLEGDHPLVIPSNLVAGRLNRSATNSAPASGNYKVKQYLKAVVTPGYFPQQVGQIVLTQNPLDGSLVLSRPNFPRMVKKGVVALEARKSVRITDQGAEWKMNYKNGGSVAIAAPIKNIPVKAEIDKEVGNSVQLFANGQTGYYAIGPVVYDERKYLFYRTTYTWESISYQGRLVWKMRNYQLFTRTGLERIYNQIPEDKNAEAVSKPFIGTITGFRSKYWAKVDPPWYIPWPFRRSRRELRSCPWPYINGGYQMMVWTGANEGNPDGILGMPIDIPPVSIIRSQ